MQYVNIIYANKSCNKEERISENNEDLAMILVGIPLELLFSGRNI